MLRGEVTERSGERPLALLQLRQRYALLDFLFDAEYGSATFVMADRPAEIEIQI